MTGENLQVYGYRWILLFIFMLGNLSLQILWISYATVTLDAAIYYSVGEFEILFLSTIFMITYIPVSFLATWFINKFGFRMGVGLGAIINGVFGWTKLSFSFIASDYDFYKSTLFLKQRFITIR